MLVTGIEALTKQKCRVELDGQLSFVVYKGELSRYQIIEQEEFSDEQYQKLLKEVLSKRARLRAMHLLTSKDRTEEELRRQLQKDGHPAEVVECALDYVKSYGYVDDRKYAERYAVCFSGKKSLNAIKWELQRKGVSGDYIEEALSGYQQKDETEEIIRLIQKKWKPKEEPEKQRRRICGYLIRKGYSIADIRKAFKKADLSLCEMELL